GPVPAVSGVLKAAYSTLKVGVPALAEEGSLGGAAGSTLLSVSDGRSAAAALEQVKDRTQAIKSAATNGFVSGRINLNILHLCILDWTDQAVILAQASRGIEQKKLGV